MNLRRTPLVPPKGLDVAPMAPPTPMQFAQPAPADDGYNMMASAIQQSPPMGWNRPDDKGGQAPAGAEGKAGGGGPEGMAVPFGGQEQMQFTDSPLLQRRKPAFADMMGAAMMGNA